MKEFLDTPQLEQQLRTVPMPYVAMAVGVPGSGKTTVLKKLAAKLEAVYVSPDEIREEITGSQHDQSANAQVWSIAYSRVKAALQAGTSVVVDATHASHRSSAVKQYRSYGATSVIAITFTVPLAVAKQRNATRDRVVDETVLDKMHARLESKPLRLEEGFDAILHYKSSPKISLRGAVIT